MAAAYPGAIASIAADKANSTVTADDHAPHHNQLAEEVVAVQTALRPNLGAVYLAEPLLYPPETPHADDDEFDYANGTDLTTEGWSWANQASATQQAIRGLAQINGTTQTSGTIAGLVKAFPASGDVSWTVRAHQAAFASNQSLGIIGINGTLASPTNLEILRIRTASRVQHATWTSYALAGGVSRGEVTPVDVFLPTYVRFSLVGTTLTSSYALAGALHDPANWATVTSRTVTRFDYYGICSITEGATANQICCFQFFRVNWTPDFDPFG